MKPNCGGIVFLQRTSYPLGTARGKGEGRVLHGVCYYTCDSKGNLGEGSVLPPPRPLLQAGVSHALLGLVEHALYVFLQDTLGDRAHHGIDHLPLLEEQ
jgi:hypothetical protein